MDEKYTPYNHKGTKIDGVDHKHRGTPATKRGLSNQQVCIITTIQRFGHTIARKLNYGKPSSIDLLRFGKCLESKSFVMQRETQGMDNTEKLQYVLFRLKNIYKITRLKDLKTEWLFA